MKNADWGSCLLSIDVGNTSTSYGLLKSGRLIGNWNGNDSVIPKIYNFICKSGVICQINCIISSVNQKNYLKVKSRLNKLKLLGKTFTIKRSIHVRINHKYININKLGSDRIVNIYGALRWYSKPCLVIDFGTATTVDYISKTGVYEGGLIIPGVETSWNALEERRRFCQSSF